MPRKGSITMKKQAAILLAAALLLAALLGLTGVWLAFPAAEGAVLLVSLRFSRSLRRARPEPAPQAITTALR